VIFSPRCDDGRWVGWITKADIVIAVVIALFGASLRFNGIL
jgi:hypothetical protein